MEFNHTLILTLCWILIFISCASSDSEVKSGASTEFDPKVKPELNKNDNLSESQHGSNTGEQVKMGKDEVGIPKELPKEVQTEHKQEQEKDRNEKKNVESGSGGDKKVKSGVVSSSGSKEITKDDTVSLPVPKDRPRGEDCDVSNSCNDDKKALVACLRVPGNESPDLSLLIQNKGKGPLSVSISAPNVVKFEKDKIQIQENGNEKVKVSIRKGGGSESLIVLMAGNGNCTLDFSDFIIPSNPRKDYSNSISGSPYTNLLKETPLVVYIVIATILVAASAWICISFQKRRHFANNIESSKYQKLDMELPVSSLPKTEPEPSDGWDNGWDDNWDDEEAPNTPSLPLTPSLSAKGIASRRFSKENWKD